MKSNRINKRTIKTGSPAYQPKAGYTPATSTSGAADRNRRRPMPLAWVLLLDVCLIGAGLLTFALFHHVIPRDIKSSGIPLPRPSTVMTSQSPAGPASSASGSQVSSSVAAGTGTGTETTPGNSTSDPAGTASDPASPTTEETADTGSWRARFASRFSDDGIIITDNTYRSDTIAIEISTHSEQGVTYYVADIYLSDISQLRTAFAGGTYGRGLRDDVLQMAMDNQAILAISGDYYSIRDQGIVIRNGELYRDVLFQDVLVLNYDGTMKTFAASDFEMAEILQTGAWQAWSFGPMLLDEGQPMTRFNSKVNPENPRGAIGYYEPGHYCFVLVDGRQPGYSDGMTLTELSGLFYQLGCTVAYNLDGGQSAIMTFMDRIVNRPYDGGREISDIISIVDPGT